jgi:ABC-2 type transport system permease protein
MAQFEYDSSRSRLPAVDELREILRYRELLVQFTRRDILTRYKRSFLGVAWTMLNPLGTMLILTFVFSQAFNQGRGYAVYILSGLVAWLFFSQSTNAAMVHLVWGEGLLKRIYLPRTVFALSAVSVGLVNLLLSLLPLALVMGLTGVPLRWSLLFLPVPVLFLAFFALGVGLLVSTLAAYFADIVEMYPILILAWMYLTPVIYPKEYLAQFSSWGGWLTRLNPMFYLVDLFRLPVYEGVLPELTQILIAGFIALGTAVLGWLVFTAKADELAYRL